MEEALTPTMFRTLTKLENNNATGSPILPHRIVEYEQRPFISKRSKLAETYLHALNPRNGKESQPDNDSGYNVGNNNPKRNLCIRGKVFGTDSQCICNQV